MTAKTFAVLLTFTALFLVLADTRKSQSHLIPDANLLNNGTLTRASQITNFTAPSLVTVGSPLEAICTTKRNSSNGPRLYFLKNYQVIADESKHVIRSSDGTFAMLAISAATLNDTGYYSCSLSSSDTVTKVVTVEEKLPETLSLSSSLSSTPNNTFFSGSSEETIELPPVVIQTLTTIDGPPPPPVITSVKVTTPTRAASIDENPQIILVSVAVGQELRLDCESRLRSSADYAILWFTKYHYRFSPIAQTEDVQWFLNGTLIFRRVETLGPKALVCVSTRLDGTREESKEVYLLVQKTPKIAAFSLPEVVPQGSNLSAICSTASGIINQRFRFTKDGSPLDESLYYIPGELKKFPGNATLYLPEVDFSDSGRYTCWAENAAGSANKSVVLRVVADSREEEEEEKMVVSSSLTVSTPNSDVEVRQTPTMMGVYAIAGHSLKLDCKLPKTSRNSSFKPKWSFANSKRPESLTNSTVHKVYPNGTLIITSLSESTHHNQLLQCINDDVTGSGRTGSSISPSKFVFLMLREGPKIIQLAAPSNVTVGESIFISCRFENFDTTANQSAKFLKNGLYFIEKNDPRVKVVEGENLALLQFNSVKLSDAADYTCWLDEFTEKTVALKVQGKNNFFF